MYLIKPSKLQHYLPDCVRRRVMFFKVVIDLVHSYYLKCFISNLYQINSLIAVARVTLTVAYHIDISAIN